MGRKRTLQPGRNEHPLTVMATGPLNDSYWRLAADAQTSAMGRKRRFSASLQIQAEPLPPVLSD